MSVNVAAGNYIEIHELTPTFTVSVGTCYRVAFIHIE